MKLTLKLDPSGECYYLETPDGQVLPNIVELKLPETFPVNYDDGWPVVTASFALQDIIIKTADIRGAAK